MTSLRKLLAAVIGIPALALLFLAQVVRRGPKAAVAKFKRLAAAGREFNSATGQS